jgi:hypothetical protein
MVRLVFSGGDPSREDIAVELQTNVTYTVQTSTFERMP